MNILQVMGCTSDQYASMERYLARKAEVLSRDGSRLVVAYENTPRSDAFVQDLRDAGGILEKCRMGGVSDRGFHSQVRALMGRHEIDVVHGYFTPTCYQLALGPRLRGFNRIVRTAANMPIGNSVERPGLAARLKHRVLAGLFRKILCRSQGVRDAFAQLGVPAERLAVADGGCDTKRYRFSEDARARLRREWGICDGELVLGVCCRLVPVKRLDRLIRRVADAAAEIPLRLLIAGDGPQREDLDSLARSLPAGGRIQFLGHRDDLPDLYSGLDIFCLSSEAEGMSNSILEAMACRLPVLATDIPPNRGLVQNGRTGYLLSFEDCGEFVTALKHVEPVEAREAMGSKGRELVEREFSVESRIHKEIAVYWEVVGQS